MRAALAALGLGLAGLVLQSAAATELPAHWVPDAGLLVAVAAALALPPFEGLLVVAALGFAADVLSGSLLGQHALLRLLELAVVRALGAQLDVARGSPFVVLAVAVTVLDAAGMAASSRLFVGGAPALPRALAELGARVVVNAAAAAPLAALVQGAAERARASRARRRRAVRLETRRPAP